MGWQKEPTPKRPRSSPKVFDFQEQQAVIKGSKGDVMVLTTSELLKLAAYATDLKMDEYRLRPDILERGRVSRILIPEYARYVASSCVDEAQGNNHLIGISLVTCTGIGFTTGTLHCSDLFGTNGVHGQLSARSTVDYLWPT